jgi:transcriptional regulator with GAF, ATPase, and Fis domain
MSSCASYMQGFMPLDHMFFQLYEPDLGAMRTIATASADEGSKVDMLTPLPKEARDRILNAVRAELEEVVVIDSEDRNPIAREMLRFHGITGSSILRMRLTTEGGRYGGVVLTADGPERFTDEHARLFELLEDPFSIALANTLVHREVMRLKNLLVDDNRYLSRELQRVSGDEIVGSDFGLRDVMRMVRQVAPTESPVLLTGETGVGKDVIANAIHLGSPRRDGPFIPVNCGAIPDSLIDSELFGHEKGAFTGALAQKRGRFERANEGTILLDEIGEMPLEAQVRLLRVLQNREIERVGGTDRIPVDIRIIAATNQDLQSLVKAGKFREDLFFRLNVFPILVPPLRNRRNDIPALTHFFIDRKAKELKIAETPRLAEGAIDGLTTYDWPGNVRELENVVERAMIIHRDESLRFDDLGAIFSQGAPTPTSLPGDQTLDLDVTMTRHIERVLDQVGGKIHGPGGAAELLGLNPNSLRSKMRKLGIPFRKDRPRT